jgi:nitroimidazol reductase NimA-like FMN-containing flavoprotein (pyridoxamine 5'-phosphate oxidase superfamily)
MGGSGKEPRASRPNMPGYGIVSAAEGRGLLPWPWARDRLVRCHNYHLATASPAGRPHSMPVWGVWIDDSFCFSTGAASRKAKNLAANPACVISTENGNEPVVVEGTATIVNDADYLERAGAAYEAKYKWKLDPSLGPIFVVRPRVAYGMIELEMPNTATRWVFDFS